jgi:hypothetical protein
MLLPHDGSHLDNLVANLRPIPIVIEGIPELRLARGVEAHNGSILGSLAPLLEGEGGPMPYFRHLDFAPEPK